MSVTLWFQIHGGRVVAELIAMTEDIRRSEQYDVANCDCFRMESWQNGYCTSLENWRA
jgi:hypothetical protein